MRDLSLHILDLMENAVRAQASVIALTVEQRIDSNRLKIVIEDNGPGLDVPADTIMNPFFTTKTGKRTGLGLSLFRATAERSGGSFTLRKSDLGGLAIEATLQFDHIDRPPIGDLSATLFAIACTNPKIDLWCHLTVDQHHHTLLKLSELSAGQNSLLVARQFAQQVRQHLNTFICH